MTERTNAVTKEQMSSDLELAFACAVKSGLLDVFGAGKTYRAIRALISATPMLPEGDAGTSGEAGSSSIEGYPESVKRVLAPSPQAPPLPKEVEEAMDYFDSLISWAGDRYDGEQALAVIKRALVPKVVTQEAFYQACAKLSGHWAGTIDDIRRIGSELLRELGIEVRP